MRLHRRWSDELKEQVVAESFLPGANVSAIARRVGIDPSQLFSWPKALRKGGVTMAAPQPDALTEDKASSRLVIEIVVGDIVIRAAAVDETHLRRVIRAVRSA